MAPGMKFVKAGIRLFTELLLLYTERVTKGLILLALAASAHALEWKGAKLAPAGYLKELWQHSRSPLDNRDYALNTLRARLSLDASAGPLRARVDYDHEALAGGYFRTASYRQAGLGESSHWLDMEQTISSGATTLWRHRLYRGWLGFETQRVTLKAGRQRIAWGTGKIWNPTDTFNPINPTSVEREERAGVDALHIRAELSELSSAELALAPEKSWPATALIGRFKSNARAVDFSLLAGKAHGSTSSWTAGGDFAGNFLDGTAYAEWSYTDPRSRRPYWKAITGYQYVFSPQAPGGPIFRESTLIVEYFHNGAGTTSVHRYDPRILLTGREVALAKDYMGFSYSKDSHSLLKLECLLLTNLDDGGHFLTPSLLWNALPDLYLAAALQRFGGGRKTEFGRLPNLILLSAQFYF